MLANVAAHGLASLAVVIVSVMVVSPDMDFGLDAAAASSSARFPLGGGAARAIWVVVCLLSIIGCAAVFSWYRAMAMAFRRLRKDAIAERDNLRVAELHYIRKRDEVEPAPQWPLV
jgi:hypothetical protein